MTPGPDDVALEELRRSLYRASGAGAGRTGTTPYIRDELLRAIAHLRDDERRYIPYDEPMLSARTTLRRRVKRSLFRSVRYMTWRYDRLLREQAALTVALADRVIALEMELQALRDHADRDGGPS